VYHVLITGMRIVTGLYFGGGLFCLSGGDNNRCSLFCLPRHTHYRTPVSTRGLAAHFGHPLNTRLTTKTHNYIPIHVCRGEECLENIRRNFVDDMIYWRTRRLTRTSGFSTRECHLQNTKPE